MHEVTQSTHSKRARRDSAFYTMSEVAGVCHLGYTTVWTQTRDGTFPVKAVKFGRQWRFPKRDVDRLAGLTDDSEGTA
jgi:excisionase family DNA binding protein